MPFFSVIIPLYNKELQIESTLQSVFNQSFKDFEVILINDGSTDKSLDKIKNFTDHRLTIYNTKNQGVSTARNTGVELANGTYIALLDSDDIWHNNHLFEFKKLIQTFPDAGLFCNNYEICFNENYIKPTEFSFTHNNRSLIIEDYFKSSLINSIAWTSSVCFSKASFLEIGAFKTHLRTGQDIDLWIRYALNYKVAFNPKVTMRYSNYDKASLSKSSFNNDRYLIIKSFTKASLTNSSLKVYLDLNRYALAIRCKVNKEIELYNTLRQELDIKHINWKQRLTLNIPSFILRRLKAIQLFLISKKIYLTAYK